MWGTHSDGQKGCVRAVFDIAVKYPRVSHFSAITELGVVPDVQSQNCSRKYPLDYSTS